MDRVGSTGDLALDHLVFGVPELDSGTALLEERLGVEAAPGGRHMGLGTHNRLVGLGPGRYLEIVAVDPEQPVPSRSRWFGLDDLTDPGLVTWCVKSPRLHELVERAAKGGVRLGRVTEGSRERPDGSTLSWSFTDPWADRVGGVLPFFIDWGDGPHPADALEARCSVRGLRVEHPDAARVSGLLDVLGLDIPVGEGHAPRLVASLQTPNGIVELSR